MESLTLPAACRGVSAFIPGAVLCGAPLHGAAKPVLAIFCKGPERKQSQLSGPSACPDCCPGCCPGCCHAVCVCGGGGVTVKTDSFLPFSTTAMFNHQSAQSERPWL